MILSIIMQMPCQSGPMTSLHFPCLFHKLLWQLCKKQCPIQKGTYSMTLRRSARAAAHLAQHSAVALSHIFSTFITPKKYVMLWAGGYHLSASVSLWKLRKVRGYLEKFFWGAISNLPFWCLDGNIASLSLLFQLKVKIHSLAICKHRKEQFW